MPVHALDVLIENATTMIKHKLCIFLNNAMETTGVPQMDTIFHSGDAWDSMP